MWRLERVVVGGWGHRTLMPRNCTKEVVDEKLPFSKQRANVVEKAKELWVNGISMSKRNVPARTGRIRRAGV